jgi:hypothetical protein
MTLCVNSHSVFGISSQAAKCPLLQAIRTQRPVPSVDSRCNVDGFSKWGEIGGIGIERVRPGSDARGDGSRHGPVAAHSAVKRPPSYRAGNPPGRSRMLDARNARVHAESARGRRPPRALLPASRRSFVPGDLPARMRGAATGHAGQQSPQTLDSRPGARPL